MNLQAIGEIRSALFAPMLATLQTAAGQIARNDCSPIREAADKIEKTARAGPIPRLSSISSSKCSA